MNVRRIILVAILAIPSLAAADDLYRLNFDGRARSVGNRLESRRVGVRDLIARCAGQAALGTNNPYELVYNATADSIQVVYATNGALVCDLLQFQGVVTNSDGRSEDRLAFVFIPEETNSVGSALIRDKIRHKSSRISLHGQIQFAMASLEPGSATVTGDANPPDTSVVQTNVTGGAGTPGVINTNVTTVPGVPTMLTTNSLGSTNALLLPSFPGTQTNSTATNSVTLPSFPGTQTNSVTTTNAVSLPSFPGTQTNSAATTNSIVLPSFPGTQSNSVTTTNSVGVPSVPGTQTNSVTATNSVPRLPSINSSTTASSSGTNLTIPGGVPNLVPSTSTSGANLATSGTTVGLTAPASLSTTSFTANDLETTSQVPLLSFTNGVICTGNFSASRRLFRTD